MTEAELLALAAQMGITIDELEVLLAAQANALGQTTLASGPAVFNNGF